MDFFFVVEIQFNRLIDDINTVFFMNNFVLIFCAAVATAVEIFTCLKVCGFISAAQFQFFKMKKKSSNLF